MNREECQLEAGVWGAVGEAGPLFGPGLPGVAVVAGQTEAIQQALASSSLPAVKGL